MPAIVRQNARMAVGRRTHQQGVVAMIVLTMFILGGAWFVFDTLNKAGSSAAVREQRTGIALKAAKEAVLAHAAATAASSTELYPGRLPCPEVRSEVSTLNQGYAGPFTGIPCDSVGRLPWRTLGIDKLTDGYGEPLWYAVQAVISAPLDLTQK